MIDSHNYRDYERLSRNVDKIEDAAIRGSSGGSVGAPAVWTGVLTTIAYGARHGVRVAGSSGSSRPRAPRRAPVVSACCAPA